MHTTWTLQDHKERISGKNPFCILSFFIPVNKPGVCEHVFPECNVMHYSPGLADWVFPECSQSVPWFCFERVSKFFGKGTKGSTTCRQGLNGSHTSHLGYQLLSPWFNLQGQEASPPTLVKMACTQYFG